MPSPSHSGSTQLTHAPVQLLDRVPVDPVAAASGELWGREVRGVDVEEGEEQQEGRMRMSAGGRGWGSSLQTHMLHVSPMRDVCMTLHDVCNMTWEVDAV